MKDMKKYDTKDAKKYDSEPMFSERELGLIQNCLDYACGDTPSGLPGHNLMIIIDKLVSIIGTQAILEAKSIVDREAGDGQEKGTS